MSGRKRIGLRTMTVAREKDQWGECFCHEVNGVRIFAMGADYIPEDNVLPRVTPERTRQLLDRCPGLPISTASVSGVAAIIPTISSMISAMSLV